MVTIDKLDKSVNDQYAVRSLMIERFNQQMHLEAASTIPPQTQVLATQVKLSEMDMLVGVIPLLMPWAYFYPPKTFTHLRRSPFAFSHVAPSLGNTQEQETTLAKVLGIATHSPEEEKEKNAIINCYKQIGKINNWLSFIVGRVGQFLQG